MFVPSNNGGCTKYSVDKARNGTYGVFITETPEVVLVYMVEELDANYVFFGLVGTFHIGFNNELIVNTELHEI